MAIRVNFALSEQKTDQNISKKQNQNSLLKFFSTIVFCKFALRIKKICPILQKSVLLNYWHK